MCWCGLTTLGCCLQTIHSKVSSLWLSCVEDIFQQWITCVACACVTSVVFFLLWFHFFTFTAGSDVKFQPHYVHIFALFANLKLTLYRIYPGLSIPGEFIIVHVSARFWKVISFDWWTWFVEQTFTYFWMQLNAMIFNHPELWVYSMSVRTQSAVVPMRFSASNNWKSNLNLQIIQMHVMQHAGTIWRPRSHTWQDLCSRQKQLYTWSF